MKIKFITLLFLGLTLPIIFLNGCEQKITATSQTLAVIKNFSGTIMLEKANTNQPVQLQTSLHLEQKLQAFDRIETGENSYLQLSFPEHGDMFVEPNTSLIINAPVESTKFKVFAELSQGIVSCFIESKHSNFAIQTPQAIAGVLGTRFQLQVDEKQTNIVLLKSEKGIEIQNLSQSLNQPFVLQTTQKIDNQPYARKLSFSEEPTARFAPLQHHAENKSKEQHVTTNEHTEKLLGTLNHIRKSVYHRTKGKMTSASQDIDETQQLEAQLQARNQAVLSLVKELKQFSFPQFNADGSITRRAIIDR